MHFFCPFQSTQFSKLFIFAFSPFKGLGWAKWEMPYSKQIQNSQIFSHVGKYCHFFGWAPRKRLISFSGQWKYIFIWRYFHFHLLVGVLAVSLREMWEVRSTRWNSWFCCCCLLCSCHLLQACCRCSQLGVAPGLLYLNCWFLFQFPPPDLFSFIPFRISIMGFF